ncbi:hypothetical protein CCAX7_15220 [Capsulimonas corticalis]|uniref:Uncharacterized protein n=1 Tax=Capsulimonas corticalis TaxID=2219043 RepID=A0A402CZB2_9BACT|nr:hypothetical protein [Capsulimonas corticalis]BDI29471.1 hypothetical protein CCAX7_15220 [Capsulimonas corticalis]
MTDELEMDLKAENARMAAMLERYAAALEAICEENSLETCRFLASEALKATAPHSHVIPDETHAPHAAYVAQALNAIDARVDASG